MSEPLSEGEREALGDAAIDDRDRRDGYSCEGPGGTDGQTPTIYEAVERIVAARERKAAEASWDEGFMYAAGQDHPAYPRTRRMTNPYGAQ